MSNPLWSHPGIRRLELGRGGGDSRKLEYLMIGALSIIIIGSIGVAIYSMIGDKTPGSQQARDVNLECVKCGHQFTKAPKDLNVGGPDGMIFEEMGIVQLDCPKCGAKKSCLAMVKCPKCEKFFLAESTKQQVAQMQLPPPRPGGQATPPPKPVRDICPHCGQDRMEWYREKYRKKKR
jgi:Zn ribbon nucleic-acid-binding protein